jgi:hypothetical protein
MSSLVNAFVFLDPKLLRRFTYLAVRTDPGDVKKTQDDTWTCQLDCYLYTIVYNVISSAPSRMTRRHPESSTSHVP